MRLRVSRIARNATANVGLAFISLVLCLVLFELGLRLYGITPANDRMSIYMFDKELGWRIRPSSRFYRTTAEYGHFNYYNSAGFPTSRRDWAQTPDRRRPSLGLIGDS